MLTDYVFEFIKMHVNVFLLLLFLGESLFDYSEASLDSNNQKLLNNCITQLSNLHRVYKFMCKKLELFELTAGNSRVLTENYNLFIMNFLFRYC